MVSIFKIGQILCGLKSTYRLLRPCHARSAFVWEASAEDFGLGRTRKVVIKNCSDHGYTLREENVLTKLKGVLGVRQIVDTIKSPPSLVMHYFEDDLRSVSLRRRLGESEIKFIACRTLQALSAAHAQNIVHTDIKPQNILVSGMDSTRARFPLNFISNLATSESGEIVKPEYIAKLKTPQQPQSVALADWAQASSPGSYSISPMSFRGPEVWLKQHWSYSADIWSFGVVMASLLMQFGNEILRSGDKGDGATVLDVLYEMHCLLGPMPPHMIPSTHQDVFNADEHEAKSRGRKWTDIARRCGISTEATQFVQDVLKLDPETRPMAKDLLRHAWLAETRDSAWK